jgi:protein phosphatase
MEYFAKSDIGNNREQNEDFYWCGNNLFIVADGMGGHTAGEVASRLAVESFVKIFLEKIQKHKAGIKNLDEDTFKNLKPSFESSDKFKIDTTTVKETLEASIGHANKEIYNLSIKRQEYAGMGTTFTGCFINSGVANVVHVGDSRLYIKRLSKLELITSDHTVVGEMYRNGLITYEEMFRHPLRNYLNNVLGLSLDVTADFNTYELAIGDILVLCSDGLNSMLKDNEIATMLNRFKEPKKITEQLIASANKKGGFDNTTVITIVV